MPVSQGFAMAAERRTFSWYVLENASGERYVGISESLFDRVRNHAVYGNNWLGPVPPGRDTHRIVAAGVLRDATSRDAHLEEMVRAVMEWADDPEVKRVRGAAFPAREIFPREVAEVKRWVKVLEEEGEDGLRAKLRAEQRKPQTAAPPTAEKGVWEHLHIKCWDKRCGGFGHMRGSPECPVVQRAKKQAALARFPLLFHSPFRAAAARDESKEARAERRDQGLFSKCYSSNEG